MFLTILALIVSAAIDSTTLFIGDQTDLHLRATAQPDKQVVLPVFDNEIIPGIEIIDRTIIDTITLADGRIQYDQYLTITSFQDSLFYIEPLPFTSGSDTIYSDALTLNVVQPFEIDSTDIAITDIKGIYRAPIWWWGIIRWVLLVFALALAGVGMHYLIEYIKRRNALQTEDATPEEPLLPAEVVALEKLNAIREEKIWQKGQIKEYYTQLTDVIREYIARRFQVSSVEQTSDETLRDIRPLLTDKALYQQLSEMLRLADLVKFAKWTTTPDENENALRSAYSFVQQTTPVEETQQ
jgi:hypothetical protein